MDRILGLVLVVVVHNLTAQTCLPKKVLDSETGEPIVGVHVFLSEDPSKGTLTNNHGSFVFCEEGAWLLSHIGYQTKLIKWDSSIAQILLVPEVVSLEEVEIVGLSALQVMHRVIDSLESNYFLINEGYEVYVRHWLYQENWEMDLFSEYLIDVMITENNRQEFMPKRVRAKSFSDIGDYYFRDMRMITGISACFEHLLSYNPDFLNKRKLRKARVVFENSDLHDQNLKIRISGLSDDKEFLLVIDPANYGIVKFITVRPKRNLISSVNFEQSGSKWYVSNSKSTGVSYSEKHPSKYEILAQFQRKENLNYSKKGFKGYVNIVAESIKAYNKDWDDPIWEQYRKDLPDWVDSLVYPD